MWFASSEFTLTEGGGENRLENWVAGRQSNKYNLLKQKTDVDEPYDFNQLILSQLQLLGSSQPSGLAWIWPLHFQERVAWLTVGENSWKPSALLLNESCSSWAAVQGQVPRAKPFKHCLCVNTSSPLFTSPSPFAFIPNCSLHSLSTTFWLPFPLCWLCPWH